MPKFCANLSFLFTDVPFMARFERAAQAGFRGVEYLFPYDFSKAEIADALRANGLVQVLFNMAPGDWGSGERGIACLPGRQAEFQDAVALGIDYALALDCRRLHCLAGLTPADGDPDLVRATYVANLRHAAEACAAHGIQVLIEPINSRIDMPGYWLDTPARAFELLDAIGRPNVAVQFDLYHAHIMAGDPAPLIERHLPRIGHVQVADHPGRHEPGSGEIGCQRLFDLLDRLGYDGWIGCEYKPQAATEAGLAWAERYLGR